MARAEGQTVPGQGGQDRWRGAVPGRCREAGTPEEDTIWKEDTRTYIY